ncbi:MAG: MaoC family dehydratase N-terminal domain-containing protein [Microbacterium sp.]
MSAHGQAIGRRLPTVQATVERGRLRFFAESVGEDAAVYTDVDAARTAGYRDLLAPPTFLFGLKLDGADPLGWLADLGIDVRLVLHGSQRFDYHRPIFAGDDVVFHSHIADIYEKRGGALEFLEVESAVTRGSELVAVLTETVVVRHPVDEDPA